MKMLRRDHAIDHFRSRITVAAVLMLLSFGLLAARLWQLQMIRGESYAQMAKENRIRILRLPSARGRILDCKGRVLADNRAGFTFSIVPGEIASSRELVGAYAGLLGLTPEKMRHAIERSRSVPKFISFPLKKHLSFEEVARILTNGEEMRGVAVEVRPYRGYSFGESLCHVIGTLGEVTPEELSQLSHVGYRSGDLVAKTGIEKQYENFLRGTDGWAQIEIDAKGKQLPPGSGFPLGSLPRKEPITGCDVCLTVDVALQQFVEKAFGNRAGSVVVMDPDTGKILAVVSKPGFDLDLFSPSISQRDWKTLYKDPLHPLENRGVRGLYAPASTFKIVTAATALAENLVNINEKVECKGAFEAAGQTFRCWNPYGHGQVALHRAIVESCDVYFYKLGLKVGVDRMAKYAALFGLGNPTGISLPEELPGLVPTTPWKMRTYGEPFKDGETLAVAIGQGYMVSTPLQLAVMTSAMVNGGKLLRPAIVDTIKSSDGKTVFAHSPVVRGTIPLSDKQMAFLRGAMEGSVSEKSGTGRRCAVPGLRIGGKTGTAQVIKLREPGIAEEKIPYHERTHAIFVAYVDGKDRKLAVAVVVEHGGGGGAVASPIAREIITQFYGKPQAEASAR
ncbi:MAG: penicillin-binding protein 2 [Thermodesulfobacteriota bacterium]